MLTSTLNTNEIKDSAGVEVEFTKVESAGRSVVFRKVNEAPNLQHRLSIRHEEIGSGEDLRRRSATRFDLEVIGVSGKKRKGSAYLVTDSPIGDLPDLSNPKMVLANLLSFFATTGAGTTVLFDCSGTGAQAHLNAEVI